MTRTEALVFMAVAVLLVGGAAVWRVESDSSKQKHCNESLNGLAVKEGTYGRVICLRMDAVLKVYD